jgi:phosphatidate cytidylyltransferase
LTAFIGIPIVLLLVWMGGWPFRFFCFALAIGALTELQVAVARSDRLAGARIIGLVAYPAIFIAMWRGFSPSFALGLVAALFGLAVFRFGRSSKLTLPSLAMTILATFYIGLFALLPMLRNTGQGQLLLLMLLAVWASDTAAYFAGRKFGLTKVSPLSPGKTWEGMVCGAFAAILVSMLTAQMFHFPPVAGISMGFVIAVFAPLGDLAESFWKRELGVKDMGGIFPGHGGILDRCDSIIFAALGLSLYILYQARY